MGNDAPSAEKGCQAAATPKLQCTFDDPETEELWEYLCGNDVKLLSIRWLVSKFEEAAWSRAPSLLPILDRCQDLPCEAFFSREVLKKRLAEPGWQIVSLSYPWASPANPDPFYCVASNVAWWWWQYKDDFPLFWDHKSLPQPIMDPAWSGKPEEREQMTIVPRTAEEEKQFALQLEGMQGMYNHSKTYVLVYPHVPSSRVVRDIAESSPYALNLVHYKERGWPAMEVLGGLMKGLVSFLRPMRTGPRDGDLRHPCELRCEGPDCVIRDGEQQAHAAGVAALMTPAKFKKFLEEKVFTNDTDRQLVVNMYEKAFNQAAARNREQHIKLRAFESKETLDDICSALAMFKKLEVVSCWFAFTPSGSQAEEFCIAPHDDVVLAEIRSSGDRWERVSKRGELMIEGLRKVRDLNVQVLLHWRVCTESQWLEERVGSEWKILDQSRLEALVAE